MKSRRLVLRRETLTELGTDELTRVGGAGSDPCVTFTIVPTGCMCTGIWPSLNVPCQTTAIIDTVE